MTRSVFNHRRSTSQSGLLLSADDFNTGSSSAAIGSTDGTGTLDPLTWTTFNSSVATWRRNTSGGGQATESQVPTGNDKVVVDLGVADVDLSLSVTAGQNQGGICFRLTGTNDYWKFIRATSGSIYQLWKVVSGTATQIGSNVTGSSGSLRVVAVGSSITCYAGGVSQITTTDSFNVSATKHGIFCNDQNTGSSFDNWQAKVP